MPSKTENAIELVPVEIKQIIPADYFLELQEKAQLVAAEALKVKIKDYPDLDIADTMAKKINAAIKLTTNYCKDKLKPVKDDIKKVEQNKRVVLGPLDNAMEHLDNERSQFRAQKQEEQKQKQKAARREQERRQKISIAQAGTGEHIKPVSPPVDELALKSSTNVRRIPDREKIRSAIEKALQPKLSKIRIEFDIPGVRVWVEPKFDIFDSAAIPDSFRRDSFID